MAGFFKKFGDAQPKEQVSSEDPTRAITPIADIPIVDSTDADADILLLRNLRATIVNNLAGGKVPTNSKDLAMMREVMNDMSRDALTRLRINVDQKQVDATEQNKLLIQQFLSGGHIRLRPIEVIEGATPTAAPQLPTGVIDDSFVPDETAQGTIHDTIEKFAERTGKVDFAAENKPD